MHATRWSALCAFILYVACPAAFAASATVVGSEGAGTVSLEVGCDSGGVETHEIKTGTLPNRGNVITFQNVTGSEPGNATTPPASSVGGGSATPCGQSTHVGPAVIRPVDVPEEVFSFASCDEHWDTCDAIADGRLQLVDGRGNPVSDPSLCPPDPVLCPPPPPPAPVCAYGHFVYLPAPEPDKPPLEVWICDSWVICSMDSSHVSYGLCTD